MKYSSKIISSKMIFYIVQVITLVFLCATGSSAAIKKPNTSSKTQASVKTNPSLDKIQSYLTELKTVGINFTQIDSSGAKYNGILLIKKPSMFRANYDPPHPLAIVGTQNFISIYDYELNEVSRIDPKDNIFKFLMEDSVLINSNLTILDVEDRKQDIMLTLSHKETDQKARISFSKKPIRIISLEVPDDGGNFLKGVTTILFEAPKDMLKSPSELFIFKNPNVYGIPKRFTREDIEKIIYKK